MAAIRVGTCGYSYYDPSEGWKYTYPSTLAAFAAVFDHLEFDRPFSDRPRVSTAERWRSEIEAGSGQRPFTVSLKAWQAMTHAISSPTWRDNDDALSEVERAAVGYLRPNDTVREA